MSPPDFQLALDFANSRKLRRGQPIDEIQSAVDLRNWLTTATGGQIVLPLDGAPSVDRVFLGEAMRLRDALRELLSALSEHETPAPETLFVLDRATERAPVRLRISATGADIVTETRQATPDPVWAALGLLVQSIGALVTSVDRNRLRACANPECPQFFIDTSRGGQRRWCSMNTCGTRDKVARHRQRATD